MGRDGMGWMDGWTDGWAIAIDCCEVGVAPEGVPRKCVSVILQRRSSHRPLNGCGEESCPLPACHEGLYMA